MARTTRCFSCNVVKLWTEMHGYGECVQCEKIREIKQREESGLMLDKGIEADKAIKNTILSFPSIFGMRAFPGKVIRISEHLSFVKQGRIILYTEYKREVWWAPFIKTTVSELRTQCIPISEIQKQKVSNFVHLRIKNTLADKTINKRCDDAGNQNR